MAKQYKKWYHILSWVILCFTAAFVFYLIASPHGSKSSRRLKAHKILLFDALKEYIKKHNKLPDKKEFHSLRHYESERFFKEQGMTLYYDPDGVNFNKDVHGILILSQPNQKKLLVIRKLKADSKEGATIELQSSEIEYDTK